MPHDDGDLMELLDDLTLTRLLHAWKDGSADARDDAFTRVYEELHAVARRLTAHRPPGDSFRPTALVHEAWLRLSTGSAPAWESRRGFFFAAARAMRDALVESARARGRVKRGGGRRPIDLDGLDVAADTPAEVLLDIDAALEKLATHDDRLRRLVELRFFAGLGNEEAALALGVSLSTVERDWRFTRAWLRRELDGADGPPR